MKKYVDIKLNLYIKVCGYQIKSVHKSMWTLSQCRDSESKFSSTPRPVSLGQSPRQQSFPIQIRLLLNTKIIQMGRNTNNIGQIWKTLKKYDYLQSLLSRARINNLSKYKYNILIKSFK